MKYIKKITSFFLNPRFRYSEMPALNQDMGNEKEGEAPSGKRYSLGYRNIFKNFPLIFGSVVVVGLFLVVLFGPLIAPINPYIAGKHIVPHYDSEEDKWISPPLAPSKEYPLGTDEWGNDILSMLLYGARNTLVACTFITMVRLILGLILGAYAGWSEGNTSDQIIMGAIGVIMAIPMLISSMILIFALDIRRGLPVFIVALSIIGWTEIAQYIRSEFIVLRKMPYIEGARAVGSRNFAIAVRHVLPNILPQLLVIIFLELGAVLMLLGELAFIGVFIGGGSRIALGDEMTGIQVITQSQVPEWGAMLAEGYRWLRAKPFIVFPPAFAFFIAVIGLIAFGEGLRRFIETHHVSTNFLLRKRMLLVIAILSFSTVFIINNTGPAPWFVKVARAFDGDSAHTFTTALAAMEGRGSGQQGGEQAATFIAQKFEDFGLHPGWSHSSYIFPLETRLVRSVTQPELIILNAQNANEPLRHQLDFGFMTEGHAGSGTAEAQLTFVRFTEKPGDYTWEAFKGMDLRDRIVIILEGNAPDEFVAEALIRGARGALWITGDGRDDVRSQYQLMSTKGSSLVKPTIPVFRIRPGVAQKLFSVDGITLSDLLTVKDDHSQSGPGWFTKNLNVKVRMSVQLEEVKTIDVPCILGYLPGSDYVLANEMVVVVANYDGLGIDPDGTVYSGANHNASSIGVLLEVARLWQEQELDPRRMVLFIAWGGGQFEDPGVEEFLSDTSSFRYLPATSSSRQREPYTIFQLDYAGAGGDALYIHPNSNQRLDKLIQATAADVGIPVTNLASELIPNDALIKVGRAATIHLSWINTDIPPVDDSIQLIKTEKLQSIGETVSLALTKIVRENSY